MIRHIVLVRFSPAINDDGQRAVMSAIENLQTTVPGILSFSGGENVSQEGRSAGFTHAFVMDFVGPAQRDAYLSHPAHVAAATKLARAADGDDGILVADFSVG